ncbi:hypothetical protein BRD10_03420 [Halobacteriales archaeon SW_12_71_31]|nr:MAG: hypothetical protein BRD10_03420 [Halobacteriales archaeon SW_12_71_31]
MNTLALARQFLVTAPVEKLLVFLAFRLGIGRCSALRSSPRPPAGDSPGRWLVTAGRSTPAPVW